MITLQSHSGTWPAGPLPCVEPTFQAGGPSTWQRWMSARPARVVILLAAVWLLNGFDLLFTILADKLGCFIELNPLAATFLDDGNYTGIILFKIALVGAGTFILWHLRRHRLAEMSCWLVAFLYVGLAFRWYRFYEAWNHYGFHTGRVYYYLPAAAQ